MENQNFWNEEVYEANAGVRQFLGPELTKFINTASKIAGAISLPFIVKSGALNLEAAKLGGGDINLDTLVPAGITLLTSLAVGMLTAQKKKEPTIKGGRLREPVPYQTLDRNGHISN